MRSANTSAIPQRWKASCTWSAEVTVMSGVSCFSFTIKLSAEMSNCFVADFWFKTSWVLEIHFSGGMYLISLSCIILAVVSRSACPGSSGPSMRRPVSLFLIARILVSRSATGTFLILIAEESVALTWSCKDAKTIVWLSKRSRLAPAISAIVAPVQSWPVTHVSKLSSAMFCPGWPCAYANVPKVCTPALLKLRLSSSDSFRSMVRWRNWASESVNLPLQMQFTLPTNLQEKVALFQYSLIERILTN